MSVIGPPHSAQATYDMTLPSALGTAGQFLKIDSVSGGSAATLAWDTVSVTDITKTSGNITIDAQGDNTDIIFKGTDGGTDTTFLTLDGSEAGKATFNSDIETTSGDIVLKGTGKSLKFGDGDALLTHDNGVGLTVQLDSSVSGAYEPVLQLKQVGDAAQGPIILFNHHGSDALSLIHI